MLSCTHCHPAVNRWQGSRQVYVFQEKTTHYLALQHHRPPGCGPACLCTSCLLRERLLHPPALTELRPTSCSWVVRGRSPLKLAQRKQEQPSAGVGGPGPSSLHLGPRGLCLRSACLLRSVGCPGPRGPCPRRSTACTLLYPPLRPHFSTTFQLSFSQLTD